jgi:hypothetical protein
MDTWVAMWAVARTREGAASTPGPSESSTAPWWPEAAKGRPPRKTEPYVEPDYGAIWAKRWGWMKPVLLAIGVGLIALLAWAAMRGDAGPL